MRQPILAAALLLLLPLPHRTDAATELFTTTAPASLRGPEAVASTAPQSISGGASVSGGGSLGGQPVPVVVYDGESIEQVVRRTAQDESLPDTALAPLRELVTQRSLQAVGDQGLRRQLCRIPMSLTVPSDLSVSGEGMQQGVVLTIYEDTEPAELAKQLAARYLLPAAETTRLHGLIEDAMLERLRLRVTIEMGDEKRILAVKKGETAASAAGRFGAKFGLNDAAVDRLAAHIQEKLPPVKADLDVKDAEWRK